jgi:X-linked retinitis pigmentosa GTPase regulator
LLEENQSRCTIDEMSSSVIMMNHKRKSSKRRKHSNNGSIEGGRNSTSQAPPVTFDFTEVFVWGDDTYG